jgi:hypothetical protein
LPVLLRLSVSADDAVVSATSKFNLAVNVTVLKRASSALKRRSIRASSNEDVLDQLDSTHGVEHIQGQDEPAERYRRGVTMAGPPALQP